jgi:putative phosphoribosyl transferase
MSVRFADRAAAGQLLAAELASMHFEYPPVVLALPRGGVPVAAEIARRLGAPLDLLLVRKIGAPWQSELALAAVVEGDPPELVIDEEVQRIARVDLREIERAKDKALREIARRRQSYLAGRAVLPLAGRTAIVVDDGIATGTTVRAALRGVRQRGPAQLVLAVPVAPPDTVARLRAEVNALVCLHTPADFRAVGSHYQDFHQVEDEEVLQALRSAQPDPAGQAHRL